MLHSSLCLYKIVKWHVANVTVDPQGKAKYINIQRMLFPSRSLLFGRGNVCLATANIVFIVSLEVTVIPILTDWDFFS